MAPPPPMDWDMLIPDPLPIPIQPPTNNTLHEGTACRRCGAAPIVGDLYRCAQAPWIDLCSHCEEAEATAPMYNPNHVYIKLKRAALPARRPYLDRDTYKDNGVEFGEAFVEDEVTRLITNAASSDTLRTLAATVRAARRDDEVLIFPLAAHITMAIREFGWDNYVAGDTARTKLELPIFRVFAAYAETLGYAMELEQGLTTVRLVPGGGGGGGGATSTDAAYLAGAQRFLADPDQVPYLLYVRQILEEAAAAGINDLEHEFDADAEVAVQFGWGDDPALVRRLVAQYAELLGWTFDLGNETVADGGVIFQARLQRDGGGNGGAIDNGGGGGGGGGDGEPMSDAEFVALTETILGAPGGYQVLSDLKNMLDASIDARKKRFVYTMDAGEAAGQFGLGAAEHGRVVDVFRAYMGEFGWVADVKRSDPPTFFLSIKKAK